MLRVLSNPRQVCSGLTRREMLQVAGAGLLGVDLPRVLAAEEAGQGTARRKAKSVIFLFLFGGPSQLDTFDMKPDAPTGIRGPFKPIASRTPGLVMCEHLPRLAAMSDQYAVIRTVNHRQNDHNACHYIQTGHPMPPAPRGAAGVNASERDWPAMGSVIEYLDRHRTQPGLRRELPSYIYLPNRLGHIQGYDRLGQYAGWLGRPYNALATHIPKRGTGDNPYFRTCADDELNFRIDGMDPSPAITLDRLQTRQRLLEQFDDQRRALESQALDTHDRFRKRALDLVTSDRVRQAFDIRQEPTRLRDRYGRHLFGQSTLLARRLIEAGSRFVTVLWDSPDGYGWDSHGHSRDVMRHLLPGLDQSLSALLGDLKERGLLEETLVVCMGEMGRTPRGNAAWGRDHWGYCFPAVLAGAGIRGGALYGRSDKDSAYPIDNPVSPEDLATTIFNALGFPPETQIHDPQGRPIHLVDGGRVLHTLF